MSTCTTGILVPPHITALKGYEPGLSADEIQQKYGLARVIKLASNENPLGASPQAIERGQQAFTHVSRYPSGGLAMRRKLAELYSVDVRNVIAGSGSEGIISNIVRTFLNDDDEVLTTDGAFLGFQVLARGRGVAYRTVPYRDWHYDLTALAAAINPKTKLIISPIPTTPLAPSSPARPSSNSTSASPNASSSSLTKPITNSAWSNSLIQTPCITASITSSPSEHFPKPMV